MGCKICSWKTTLKEHCIAIRNEFCVDIVSEVHAIIMIILEGISVLVSSRPAENTTIVT
jgi:hypothetical protein